MSPRIYDFKKMMYTPGYAGDDFMNVDPYFISDKKKKEGICLSVKGLTNGAVAVLYPEVEFLTDKVYYYCREKDKFIMLQGSLKMLVTTIRMDEEN